MTRLAAVLAIPFALAFAACGGNGEAPRAGSAGAWAVDYENSELRIHGEYGAVGFTGVFTEWDAEILFSPDDLAGSSIRAEIATGSLDTGDRDRDEAARSNRWLNAASFPTAIYEADAIEAWEDGYVARGTLSMAGFTNPLDFNFNVVIEGDTARATGATVFDHNDMGITGGYDAHDTGDLFQVTVDIVATRAN